MEVSRGIQVFTVRFLPGQELKTGIERFVEMHNLKAAFIMTCVGSVRRATLRFATPAPGQTLSTERLADRSTICRQVVICYYEMLNRVDVFTIRVRPGQDLKDSIESFVVQKNLKATFIVTCVGTLKSATLGLNATPRLGPPFPPYEKMSSKASVQVFTIRLQPGQDLKEAIEDFVEKKELEAAFIMTCVGTVEGATLRFPHPKTGPVPAMNRELTYKKEYFDILSLVGTVSLGGCHLHVVLGRADGTVVGGHLVGNAKVHTTAEVVIGDSLQEVYIRKNDPKTTFNELEIKPRK